MTHSSIFMKSPLIIKFLRPPICVPLIFAQVIPIPDASIPDSDIVTPAPTIDQR